MLAADFGNLERDTKMIDRSAAEWVHIDVMDGVFVPNISYGFPVLEALRKYTDKMMDVHLMIVEPERYVERFVKSGADIVTFHIEATKEPEKCIDLIRKAGAKAGVSIKPATPVELLEGLIDNVDLVLVMSVEPGFGGQKFIPSSIEKVIELKELISKRCSADNTPLIEVDGGISAENSGVLLRAGADALVAGSSIFCKKDPVAEIQKILES